MLRRSGPFFCKAPHAAAAAAVASAAKSATTKPAAHSHTSSSWLPDWFSASPSSTHSSSLSSWLLDPFSGLFFHNEADIKKNTPPAWRPIKRYRYHQYVVKNLKQNKWPSVFGGDTNANSGNKSAPSSSLEDVVARVGLDRKTTMALVAASLFGYVTAFAAFCWFMLVGIYAAIIFVVLGRGAPTDPARRRGALDRVFDDEFCAIDANIVVSKIQHNDDKVFVLHGSAGTGTSTLLRRVASKLATDAKRCVVYVKVTPQLLDSRGVGDSSDPVALIGCGYSLARPSFAFDCANWMAQLSGAKMTLVFDLDDVASGSNSNSNGKKDASSSSPPSFSLADFLTRAKTLTQDSDNAVQVVLSCKSYSENIPLFKANDSIASVEVPELSHEQATRFVSTLTNVYPQSIMRYSRKNVRFLRERLARAIQEEEQGGGGGNGGGDPLVRARALLKDEYDHMTNATRAVFAPCRNGGARLRKILVEQQQQNQQPELLWADIAADCSGTYSSMEAFMREGGAEVRSGGAFVSASSSSCKPAYRVVSEKVLAGKKFGEK